MNLFPVQGEPAACILAQNAGKDIAVLWLTGEAATITVAAVYQNDKEDEALLDGLLRSGLNWALLHGYLFAGISDRVKEEWHEPLKKLHFLKEDLFSIQEFFMREKHCGG